MIIAVFHELSCTTKGLVIGNFSNLIYYYFAARSIDRIITIFFAAMITPICLWKKNEAIRCSMATGKAQGAISLLIAAIKTRVDWVAN